MKNKLNPRQYDPYALNTPSGNLIFEEQVDHFDCHLSEYLTGDFNITGSLQVNDGTSLFVENENVYLSGNSFITNLNLGNSNRTAPTAFDSVGNSGDIAFDTGYLYLCTGDNAWGRVAVSAW